MADRPSCSCWHARDDLSCDEWSSSSSRQADRHQYRWTARSSPPSYSSFHVPQAPSHQLQQQQLPPTSSHWIWNRQGCQNPCPNLIYANSIPKCTLWRPLRGWSPWWPRVKETAASLPWPYRKPISHDRQSCWHCWLLLVDLFDSNFKLRSSIL